ncbi:MAG: NAD-dependent epimerase/dehydratase family protein [Holosporales bacterium]|jgi:nucleoside-diphosphate-sugar epimerase|nr:NAD-dependent epimerase/dehydratase family protein [Holosporales bacterium]
MILVTGASGFVGSALCRHLSQQKRPYHGLSRTRPLWAQGENAALFSSLDLCSASCATLKALCPAGGTIVHCAGRAHIMQETESDPESAFHALNVEATQKLLEAAEAKGVQRFIFVSSIKVNGERASQEIPFHEEALLHPEDAYARSKAQAEQIVKNYTSRLETVILRPPLMYGPRAQGNFALLARAVRGRWPLPLASIKNKRSFLFLENMVSALVACLDAPQAAGETFLVSDTEALSTPELIRGLAQGVGHSATLFPCPPKLLHHLGTLLHKQDHIRRLTDSLVIDTRKIRNLLHWTPPYTAWEGLKKTGKSYDPEQAAL